MDVDRFYKKRKNKQGTPIVPEDRDLYCIVYNNYIFMRR
jgi:hypothetical protein